MVLPVLFEGETKAVIELVEPLTDRVAGAGKPSYLDQLRWRNMRLSNEQMSDDRIIGGKSGRPLGQWKDEALGIVEWISRRRGETPVPHQVRVERGIHHRGCPTLIAWTDTGRPDDTIVLNANGDRLSVPEPRRGRMATGTGIVVMQSG